MAILFDAPVPPDDLTVFVREVPVPLAFALTAAFPERFTDDNTIDFAEIVRTNRTARFRSFDGRIHVSERDSGSDSRVKLLPLSSSLTMGEYERLQLQFARTAGTNRAALANAIYNDGENLVREIRARMEQAWGDVLTDGKLTINENGFRGEADFGVPANHLVAPATPWTTTGSATALDDLIAWLDTYVATNGSLPGATRTSQRVQRLLQRNAQIVAAVHGSASGKTRVNLDEIGDLFASEGIPPLVAPYDAQVDVDGVATRVIPDDRLSFTPADLGDLGYTAYGVSATALELVGSNEADLSFEDAPGIVGVIDKSGPPYREQTLVDAVGMPVLSNARRLFVADVA